MVMKHSGQKTMKELGTDLHESWQEFEEELEEDWSGLSGIWKRITGASKLLERMDGFDGVSGLNAGELDTYFFVSSGTFKLTTVIDVDNDEKFEIDEEIEFADYDDAEAFGDAVAEAWLIGAEELE